MIETHVLANHGSVFRFHQTVVVGMPRPRFRLRDQQLVEQGLHVVVDELATVIGMEAENTERKLPQQALPQRLQPSFGYALDRTDHLPLRDFIHCVDVINALRSS